MVQQSQLCSYVPLPYHLIEVAGNEAEKYLQGQLTCDVTRLSYGEQTLSAYCDPQGKVTAIFRLYRMNSDKFIIIIEQSLVERTLQQLKKYAVFSKVTFHCPATIVFGIISAQPLNLTENNATLLSIPNTSAPFRYLYWGENIDATSLNADDNALFLWQLIEIKSGIPQFNFAHQAKFVPQALNLQSLEQTLCFNKGCYMGQETIARAKYRGANKKQMAIFMANIGEYTEQTLQACIGEAIEVQLAGQFKQTGTILVCIANAQELWLQVVLNKEILAEASQFKLHDVPLKYYNLPYEIT